MPLYLNTRGRNVVAVKVCDRCKMKRFADFLVSDPNAPGLQVCRDTCMDVLDPWRKAPRMTEDITVRGVRPEVSVSTTLNFYVAYSPVSGSFAVGETFYGQQSRTQGVITSIVFGQYINFTIAQGLDFFVGELLVGASSGATGLAESVVSPGTTTGLGATSISGSAISGVAISGV